LLHSQCCQVEPKCDSTLTIALSKSNVVVCRTHMLQADSEEECQAWIASIQAGVSKAYNRALSTAMDSVCTLTVDTTITT
jgi:hypothetical protein